jgi:outer membrane protein TolC
MFRISFRASLLILLELIVAPLMRAQAPAGGSAPPVLTLNDALRIAEAHNRDLQVSELNVAKAREGVAEARTYYFPKLDTYVLGGAPLQPIKFTIPAGSLGTYPSTGPLPGKNATISSPEQLSAFLNGSAAQPLTQLYKIHLQVGQARLNINLSQEQVRGQRQETDRQVKEVYYQLSELQSQVESAEATVRYLTELSGLAERRLKVQTILASDLLTIQAKLKQAEYQLLTLQDSIDIQKQSLNQLLGRDLSTQFSVEDEPLPDDTELSLEAARKEALEQRPDVHEANLEIQIAQLDVRRERAEYIPNISLQVSDLSFQNISFLPQNAASAGFLMQWQPFDWGYKRHKIAELKTVTQQKVLTEQNTEQQVLLNVDDTFRKLKEARLLLDARADERQAEQEKLREMTNRYAQQTALLSDLLQQESAVSQAEAQYQQALQGFWTARTEFEKATGVN